MTKTEIKILKELLAQGDRGKSYESGLKGRRGWGSRVAKMVGRLEKKGLITVLRDSHNHGRHGRVDIHMSHFCRLTEEGREVAESLQ